MFFFSLLALVAVFTTKRRITLKEISPEEVEKKCARMLSVGLYETIINMYFYILKERKIFFFYIYI